MVEIFHSKSGINLDRVHSQIVKRE